MGAEPPVYELIGHSLRVHFKAFKGAQIDQLRDASDQSGGLNGGLNGGLAEKILALIRSDASVTVLEMAKVLQIPKRTIEREIKKLRDEQRIVREGGNRYGHWKINE